MASSIEYDFPRIIDGVPAQVGDLINDPSVTGFSVVTYIGPSTQTPPYYQKGGPFYCIKFKRICDHHFNTYKNPKEREIHTGGIPNRITHEHLAGLKAGISMLESYIK